MKQWKQTILASAAAAVLFVGCNGGASDEASGAAVVEGDPTLQPKAAATPGADEHPALLVPHEITFYGWPDNSPPGSAIRSPQIHDRAGGVGTYDNPVTFAASPDAYPPGTILYVPYLKKYLIMEDRCSACVGDWGRGQRHIDIWMESNASNGAALRDCQRYWTRGSIDVELNPPRDRPVDASPLFDPGRGVCRQ